MLSVVRRDRRLRDLLGVAVFVAALVTSCWASAQRPARPAPTPSPAAQPPATPPAPPVAPPPAEIPPAAVLGGPGESCRARSDCKAGLLCKSQMCVDPHEGESCGATPDCGGELKCIGGICRSPFTPPTAVPPIAPSYPPPGAYPAPPPGAPPPSPDKSDWLAFKLEGKHGFVGMTFIGGPSVLLASGSGPDNSLFVDKGFLWALKFGGLFGRNEIALELSPMTYLPFTGLGPSFQTNFTYGYLAKVYEGSPASVYWPVRFGIGTFLGNTGGLAFFETRADLIGLAVQVGHVLIDLHAPSFRYAVSPNDQTLHFMSWDFGGGLAYAF